MEFGGILFEEKHVDRVINAGIELVTATTIPSQKRKNCKLQPQNKEHARFNCFCNTISDTVSIILLQPLPQFNTTTVFLLA